MPSGCPLRRGGQIIVRLEGSAVKKSPNKLESMGLTVNKRSTLKTLMSQWQLMLMSTPVLL